MFVNVLNEKRHLFYQQVSIFVVVCLHVYSDCAGFDFEASRAGNNKAHNYNRIFF